MYLYLPLVPIFLVFSKNILVNYAPYEYNISNLVDHREDGLHARYNGGNMQKTTMCMCSGRGNHDVGRPLS